MTQQGARARNLWRQLVHKLRRSVSDSCQQLNARRTIRIRAHILTHALIRIRPHFRPWDQQRQVLSRESVCDQTLSHPPKTNLQSLLI
jgi:hypothetical protein